MEIEKMVERYIDRFDRENNYVENAIKFLINKFPINTNIDVVIPKLATINSLYSTFIPNNKIIDMAIHIVNQNIDSKIDTIDHLSIIDNIATGHNIVQNKGYKPSRFYSFATKYCNWHRPNSFPIYDTYSRIALVHLCKTGHIQKFKVVDLQNCSYLKCVISGLIAKYSLSRYSLKDIDKFLWLYGMDISSRTQTI